MKVLVSEYIKHDHGTTRKRFQDTRDHQRAVDKTRNMEHPGTSNIYNNYEKNM